MIGPSTGCSQSGWRQTVLPECGVFSLSILFFIAFFLFSFQISTSVSAIDTTATPTRCAPTLRALIIAFVKKATSVTDFSARKKANKRKEQNQDAPSKKEKGRYWRFPCLLSSWLWMFCPQRNLVSVTAIPVRRGLCPQDWIVSSKRVGTLKLALVNIFFFMERSPAWLPCGG